MTVHYNESQIFCMVVPALWQLHGYSYNVILSPMGCHRDQFLVYQYFCCTAVTCRQLPTHHATPYDSNATLSIYFCVPLTEQLFAENSPLLWNRVVSLRERFSGFRVTRNPRCKMYRQSYHSPLKYPGIGLTVVTSQPELSTNIFFRSP